MWNQRRPSYGESKSRISAESWQQRVEQAQRDEVPVRKILDEVEKGLTLNEAIAKVLPANRRSWALRRIPAYREQGVEALIDARTPREPTVSRECAHAVQAARETNPRVTVSDMLELLHKLRVSPLPSASTIKREFARVDERRKYARKKARAKGDVEVIELPLAGGELLAAAETESGGIDLGVAHGVPGLIGMLTQFVDAHVEPERSRRLLGSAVAWLYVPSPKANPALDVAGRPMKLMPNGSRGVMAMPVSAAFYCMPVALSSPPSSKPQRSSCFTAWLNH